jgi:predicted translin family RNA/ssDNA-binding protein
MQGGAILSIVYLLLGLAQMFILAPDLYPIDFKIRFPAIFLSIAFFTYSYEKIRIIAQNNMEEAQHKLEEEKEKLAESDRALQDFKALVKGKTITITESN